MCYSFRSLNPSATRWSQIQHHLQGIWNNNDLGLDLLQLHKQIRALNTHSETMSPNEEAGGFAQAFNSFMSLPPMLASFTSIGIFLFLLLLKLCLFPVFSRLLSNSIQEVATQVHKLHRKNKKGGDVGRGATGAATSTI